MRDNKPLPSQEYRPEPLLLKVAAACHMLQVSRSELYRLMESGEIRGILIGPRQRRIPTEECRAWLKRKLAETGERSPEPDAA